MRSRRQFNIAIGASWIILGLFAFHFYRERNELSWNGFSKSIQPAIYENAAHETRKSSIQGFLYPTLRSAASPDLQTQSSSIPKPTLTSSPSAQATKQPSSVPDRIIVMGKTKSEDTTWVQEHLPEWQSAIYAVDDLNATTLHTSANKGREAVPYLAYLVDHYHSLPSTISFLHAHRKGYPEAWHNDAPNYDNVIAMRTLNINFIQRNGYANLRCVGDPGCPGEVQPFRDPPEEHRTIEAAMPDAWRELFNNTKVPHTLATPCCGQFAVSKEQVLKRPLTDYQRYLDWLLNTPLKDETCGRVFEYLWHIIFGQEAIYCPAVEKCYCDVYGRC